MAARCYAEMHNPYYLEHAVFRSLKIALCSNQAAVAFRQRAIAEAHPALRDGHRKFSLSREKRSQVDRTIVDQFKFVSARRRNQHAGSVRSPDTGTPRQGEAASEFTLVLRELCRLSKRRSAAATKPGLDLGSFREDAETTSPQRTLRRISCARRGSNAQPSAPEADALSN